MPRYNGNTPAFKLGEIVEVGSYHFKYSYDNKNKIKAKVAFIFPEQMSFDFDEIQPFDYLLLSVDEDNWPIDEDYAVVNEFFIDKIDGKYVNIGGATFYDGQTE